MSPKPRTGRNWTLLILAVVLAVGIFAVVIRSRTPRVDVTVKVFRK